VLNTYGGILMPDKLVNPDNDSTFMFTEFPEFSVDGVRAGNWCRFMNHAPEGDKKTNVVAWEHYSEWGPRIIFTACHRGIKKGAQLLYSYGDSYWDEDEDSPENLS
jgi:SET domain-containing protein